MSSLLEIISDEAFLRDAWRKLNKSNPESHGVSEDTIAKFRENIDERLYLISSELRKGKFRFSPNRPVAIKKANGKYRPLQIPEIQDRIVLKAIAIKLEEHFEPIISLSEGLSFAYQKKLGVRNAVQKMVELYQKGNTVILEADIVNFFGEVDKVRLINNDIFPKLPDDSINDLITQGLSQPIKGIEELENDQQKVFEGISDGIPQGNALSPLFSNIFLSPFDQFMKNEGYNLIRYADDFIVMCKTELEAMNCFKSSSKFLNKELNLDLHDLKSEKSKIVRPNQDLFSFLSVEFDGDKYYPSQESFEKLKNKIRSLCNASPDSINIIDLLIKTRNRIDGWLSAFYYTDVDRFIEELDYFIDRQIYLALGKLDWKISQKAKGQLPRKYAHHGESRDCLSPKQRQSSGIRYGKDVLKSIREEQERIPKN